MISEVTWVLWNLVSVRLEVVLVLVQDRCTVSATCTIGSETFWTHPMVLLGDEAHVEYLISVNLEKVLILMQHRCPVCAETYHRPGNRLDAPDGTAK